MRTCQLGDTTGGVWTRAQALEVVSASALRGLLAAGTWQVLLPGVYTDAGIEPDAVSRAYAAVLASGAVRERDGRRRVRAAASGRTAARLHGLVLVDDDDPATGASEHRVDEVVVRQHARSLVAADGRSVLRRQPVLAAGDVVEHRPGLWTTSLLRTVADCALVLSPEALVCLLDDVLHRGLMTPAQLDGLVAQRRGRPGGSALATAAALADPLAESPAETLVRLLLRPHVPDLVLQHRVRDGAGRVVARVDLAVVRRRLAVEADGKRGHAGSEMLADDQRRDAGTRALSWHTERVRWYDVRCRPGEVVRRVLGAVAARPDVD